MLHNLNLSSILLIIIGLLLVAYGGWSLYRYRDYTWAAGMICLGVGNALFGVTNGFSDMTPKGRVFMKTGVTLLLFGIIIAGYVLSRRM